MSEGVAGNEKEGVRERGRGREKKKEDLVSRASLGPRGRCRTEGRETREKGKRMRKSERNGEGTWICHFFERKGAEERRKDSETLTTRDLLMN